MKPDLLAAADVVVSVVDNTQETFGLSILEALGHGRPVVASRFDGYKDLVDDGVDGLLVDTLWCEADPLAGLGDVMDPNVAQLIQAQSVAIDTEQLADHLRALIADEPRRLAMGAAGRAKVRERFRASAVVRQYEALVGRARGRRRRRSTTGARRRRSRRHAASARRPSTPAALSPSQIFRAYPTGFLSPDDTLATVPGVAIDPPYSDVAVLLDRALLEAIRDRCATPARVRDVVGAGAHRGARLVRRDVAAEVRRAARQRARLTPACHAGPREARGAPAPRYAAPR